MNNLFDRINELCKSAGITIGKMCSELGISRGNLSDLKAGRTKTLSAEKLQTISNHFSVSIDYLLGETEFKTKEEMYKHFNKTHDLEKIKAELQSITDYIEHVEPKTGYKIPVLGRVAAGVPIEAIEGIDDWEEIPEEWTRSGDEFFGLRVRGDSMYPEYLEDDIVIVRKAPDCRSGQDCVVYANGYDATLKTVIKNSDGSITLKPINPTYAPTTYSPEEIENLPVSLCGVVVELRRKK